jgi:hypothetical protein
MLFTTMYRLLAESNPKAVALQRVLVQNGQSDAPTLIVVRDRVGELATQSWCEALRSADEIDAIPSVVSCASFGDAPGDPGTTTILSGVLHRRYAWICSASLGRRATWLSYRGEVDAIRAQLTMLQGEEAVRLRCDLRLSATAQLGARAAFGALRPEAPCGPLRISVNPPQTAKAQEPRKLRTIQTGGFQGLADALRKQVDTLPVKAHPALGAGARLDDDAPLDGVEADFESLQEVGDDVVVAYVHSDRSGTRSIRIPATEMVEVARYRTMMDLLRVEASSLQVGDILLLTHGERRVSLFEEIAQLAEQQPDLAFLHHYRRKWRAAVAAMATRFSSGSRLSYSDMLVAVRDAGSPVTTELTLRAWVKEERIGPDALESIIAVGRLTGINEIVSDAPKFDQAFRRLRGIRAGIGRRLSTSLRNSFAQAISGADTDLDDADPFDDHLGLPADELIAALDPSEVLEVLRSMPDEDRLVSRATTG